MKSYESQPAGSLFVMVPPFMSGFRALRGSASHAGSPLKAKINAT
jgi:hypothetical protein